MVAELDPISAIFGDQVADEPRELTDSEKLAIIVKAARNWVATDQSAPDRRDPDGPFGWGARVATRGCGRFVLSVNDGKVKR